MAVKFEIISHYRELTSPKNDLMNETFITTTAKPLDNYYSQRLKSLNHIPMPKRSELPRRNISDEFLLRCDALKIAAKTLK